MENIRSENDPLTEKTDSARVDTRVQRNYFALICEPLRRLLNYFRNLFCSNESTDGKITASRPWRHCLRRLRKFFSRSRQTYSINDHPRLTLPKLNLPYEYDMSHEKRGLAVIFNHKYFDADTGYGTRNGTEVDFDKLIKTCQTLEFTIESFEDLKRVDIFRQLEKISNQDHSKCDCILIAILTHGERGQIFSRDDAYDIEQVTSYFTDEACPTLSGKPKLFLIQSCRGKNFDFGHPMSYSLNYRLQRQDLRGGVEKIDVTAFGKVPMEMEAEEMVHNPPNHPDFLIVRSTMPDYVSFRNTTHGSWFIQHLCDELNKFGNRMDILTLLTLVNQRVSEKESSEGRFKQILCISTMLTKQLIFYNKSH